MHMAICFLSTIATIKLILATCRVNLLSTTRLHSYSILSLAELCRRRYLIVIIDCNVMNTISLLSFSYWLSSMKTYQHEKHKKSDIAIIRLLQFMDRLFLARLHEVQKSYCSHPGRTRSRSRSRSTLLKFSRSLYLCNHSSESIHTWTIGTQ